MLSNIIKDAIERLLANQMSFITSSELISKNITSSHASYDEIVHLKVDWFITLNTALVIYTCAFVVHVNCFFNSVVYFLRNKKSLARYPFIFQTGLAVACHACRLTDYFFTTNCHFKGYYNFINYYLAMFVLNCFSIWKIYVYTLKPYHNLNKKLDTYNTNQSRLKHTIFSIIAGVLISLTVFQVFTELVALTNGFLSAEGELGFCIGAPNPLGLFLLTLGESTYHFLTLIIFLSILINALSSLPKEARSIRYLESYGTLLFFNKIGLDFGIIMLIFADVIIISLFLVLQTNKFGNVSPEVYVQLKWAFQTKLYNEVFSYSNEPITKSSQNIDDYVRVSKIFKNDLDHTKIVASSTSLHSKKAYV